MTIFIKKYNKIFILSFLILFVIIFFAARIPFYSSNWDGTDRNGHDADIFINHPKKPDYLLIARIQGVNKYASPYGHPAGPYELFAETGELFKAFIPLNILPHQQIVTDLKIIASLFQLLIFLLIFLILFLEKSENFIKTLTCLLILLILSLTPISLYSSNEFQIDSIWGIFMIGLLMFSIYIYHFKDKYPYILRVLLLFFASAFLGLGKNEWGAMLLLSVITFLVSYPIIKKIFKLDEKRNYLPLCLTIFTGTVSGTFINYLINPMLYISGWSLIQTMLFSFTLYGNQGYHFWLQQFKARLPYTLPVLLIIAFQTAVMIRLFIKKDENTGFHLFYYLISSLQFIGYFLSSWGDFSRYFAPSFTAFMFSLIITLLKTDTPRWVLEMTAVFIFLIISVNLHYDGPLYQKSQNNRFNVLRKWGEVDSKFGVIPLMDAGDLFDRNNIDFVHCGMGLDGAKSLIKKYEKEMPTYD